MLKVTANLQEMGVGNNISQIYLMERKFFTEVSHKTSVK